MSALDVALCCAAVARLSLLVARDDWPIGLLVERLRVESWLARMLSCSWCNSVWIAALWMTLWELWGTSRALQLVALVLTASLVAGIIRMIVDALEASSER